MKRYEKLPGYTKFTLNFWQNAETNNIEILKERNTAFDNVLSTLDKFAELHNKVLALDLPHILSIKEGSRWNDIEMTIDSDELIIYVSKKLKEHIIDNSIDLNFKNLRAVIAARKKKIVTKINFLSEEV